MKERALDIFVLLEQLDRKNFQVWESLTEAQRKEFSALVTMRWMAGTTDERQLLMLNELVNISIFELPQHQELFIKLLAVCSSGKTRRYQWINYKIAGSKKVKKSVELIAHHYKLSLNDAIDSRRLFSSVEILELAEIEGLQKDEISEIKKELK